jgi:hypothetical protein
MTVCSIAWHIADWLRLETLALEKEALSRLSDLSDQLRIEFKHLKKVAIKLNEWQTSETTGIETMRPVNPLT